MDSQKKEIAADCWKKGTQAVERLNWDYAIEMYSKAVAMVPDNLLYRQSVRGAERKKYDDNGSGARMARVKLVGIRGRIKKSRLQKNWAAVDRAAEDGLKINPWDAHLLADVADACRHREFIEVAVDSYRHAVLQDKKNKTFNRALAELLEQRGDYTEAAKIWEWIARLDPSDGEARSKALQVQAESVLDRGGYEGADDTRGVMADHEVAKRLGTSSAGPADGPGMSEEADLKNAIRREPEQVAHYLKLAGWYRRQAQLEDALEILQQALDASGGDAAIREQFEDVELDLMRYNLTIARDRAAQDSDDEESTRNARALATELVQREIEVLSKRVERYPNDLKIRFELAGRFVRTKKYTQAIPLYQVCVRDTRLEVASLTSLGKCFIGEKKTKLARRQFEKAAAMVDQHDEPDLFKEAHYWLARLLEEAGERDEAESHYTDVLAIDYEYKDAKERLEKVQEGES